MNKQTYVAHPAAVNYEVEVKDLNDKFKRFVKELGINNKKGSDRYNFEVDFSYALNEVKNCPLYLKAKRIESASGIVSSLIIHLKRSQGDSFKTTE